MTPKSEFNSSGDGSKAGPGTKCAEMLCFDLLTFWIILVLPVFWCCQYSSASYYSSHSCYLEASACATSLFVSQTHGWTKYVLSAAVSHSLATKFQVLLDRVSEIFEPSYSVL